MLARSREDLRLLVNEGPGPGERYVAAGVPWFTTLFGRDAVTIGLQTLAFRPQIAIETLGVLAARQATEVDPWRDAEPGKMLHELRTGEMARTGELPFAPYYGSVDATPLWLILLGETFDWTGDRALVDRLWPNAMAALRWIDEWGDRDGDGFVEYERHSERGLINQGWKDSADAVRDRNGVIARAPIALVEVQGYVYDAKRRMAASQRCAATTTLPTVWSARRMPCATGSRRRSIEDEHFYAMALDADKRRMRRHRLERRPVPVVAASCRPSERRGVATRLLDRGLFSGWGIRTYAADQPGFNPIGYHTGTVWPHDMSIIAAGLKRYGFHDEANELIGRVSRPPSSSRRPVCPSCSAASSARRPACRCRIRWPARRRAGPRAHRSCSWPRCSGCMPTPIAASSSSRDRSCPTGCAASACATCVWAMLSSTCCSIRGGGRRAPRSCARPETCR